MAWAEPFVPDVDQRIISLEDNGFWSIGRTYEVKWYLHHWRIGEFGNHNDYLYKLAPVVDRVPASDAARTIVTPMLFLDESSANQYNWETIPAPNATSFSDTNDIYDDFEDATNLIGALDTVVHTGSFSEDMGGIDPGDPSNQYLKYLVTSTFTINATRVGGAKLAYMGFWIKDNGNLGYARTQKVLYNITIGAGVPQPFPPGRPVAYNENKVWDPIAGGWTSNLADLTTLGGGRYGKRLVVIGHKKIYVGDL